MENIVSSAKTDMFRIQINPVLRKQLEDVYGKNGLTLTAVSYTHLIYIEKTFFLNYNDSNSWYCMHSACVGATRAAFKRKKANTGGYFDGNAKRLYESARWRR